MLLTKVALNVRGALMHYRWQFIFNLMYDGHVTNLISFFNSIHGPTITLNIHIYTHEYIYIHTCIKLLLMTSWFLSPNFSRFTDSLGHIDSFSQILQHHFYFNFCVNVQACKLLDEQSVFKFYYTIYQFSANNNGFYLIYNDVYYNKFMNILFCFIALFL